MFNDSKACEGLGDNPGPQIKYWKDCEASSNLWMKARATMTCPCCGQLLTDGPLQVYETLTEHVTMCGEGFIPERPTFVCANTECRAHQQGFWGLADGGSWYPQIVNLNNPIPDLPTGCVYPAEKAQYNKEGIYIGPSLWSRIVKLWDQNLRHKMCRVTHWRRLRYLKAKSIGNGWG